MITNKIIHFPSIGDKKGSLVSLESFKNVPFEIKRVYYIFGTKNGISRGFHAHRNIKQIVISIAGSCRFVLNDGINQEEIILDTPNKGLMIENLIWREMHDFSPNCILLVLASEYYEEKDYIRKYDEFLKIIGRFN